MTCISGYGAGKPGLPRQQRPETAPFPAGGVAAVLRSLAIARLRPLIVADAWLAAARCPALAALMTAFIRRHALLVLVRVPVAVAFLVLLFWRVELGDALEHIRGVDLRWVAPGLLMFTASKAIHAYRWRAFLRPHHDLPFGPLFAAFLLGNLGNAVVPFRAGDLLRIEIPARRFQIPRAELASTVLVVESVLDGVAFAILFAAAAPFIDIPGALKAPISAFIAATLVLFAASLALARLRISIDFASALPLRWLPRRLRTAVADAIPAFIDGLASLGSARALILVVSLSCLSWIAEVGVYWMLGQAFGVSLSLAEATVIMVAANLIVSVPITPWDIGPYEVFVTETLVLLGATRAAASGFSLGSHILLLSWVTVTGLAAMVALDLRLRDLLQGRRRRARL